MTENSTSSTAAAKPGTALAERLFVPWERLGWEYVPPAPPAVSPEADRRPVWTEPRAQAPAVPAGMPVPWGPAAPGPWAPPPGPSSSSRSLLPLGGCGSAVLAAVLIGAVVANGGTAALGVALVAVIAVVSVAVPNLRKRAVRARFQHERDLAFAAYERQLAQWKDRVARHDAAERRRYAAADRWFPLTARSRPERIDVFGGTSDGWASLLATMGCSLLADGADVLLLDFTEQGVGDGLASFAAEHECPVRQLTLPDEWSRWRPFAGGDAAETAGLLADVVRGVRASAGAAGTADSRALDTELIGAVLARLDRPWTYRRVTAALRVLRRLQDDTTQAGLSAHERQRLAGAVDAVGRGVQVEQELQFLTNVLDLLASAEPAEPSGPAELLKLSGPEQAAADRGEEAAGGGEQDAAGEEFGVLGAPGLTVVRTADRRARRKEVLDKAVFHRASRSLRGRGARRGPQVLVVAGADEQGREALEDLVRQAERGGVRLVLMFERLRGDLHDLLGGRHSATLLMRLGNAREATTAAEFVGRGHTFVLSQITRQVGATFTEGTSVSRGVTTGESQNTSLSLSEGHFGKVSVPFASASTSLSTSTSRSDTWQNTVNQSVAESATSGHTVSRVYEFAVEPTTVQSLPATAFVLVEVAPAGRRVVLGDCNPGIALLDRVATEPRPA